MAEAATHMNAGSQGIAVNGVELIPDLNGALYWPDEHTVIVSDLHLEKGSAFAARGKLIPPYDTAATLARLGQVLTRLMPRRVIALGDSFHDLGAGERIADTDVKLLTGLQSGRDWIWITGNHDPEIPSVLPGDQTEELNQGALTFRHEPQPAPAPGEIAGHLHPCARIASGGRRLRRRCYVGDGTRLLLPAFGAYTGGLNILHEAYDGLFDSQLEVHAIGSSSIYRIRRRQLLSD